MTDLTPDLVRRAGLALYGEQWKGPLADLLATTSRTLRRLEAAHHRGEPYDVNPAWAGPLKAALESVPALRRQQEAFALEVLAALADVEARPADDPRERMRNGPRPPRP